jgi:hypothetical protein
MHSETLDYAKAGLSTAPIGLFRRVLEGVRSVGVRYELDAHLAQDIGAPSYTVPVFSHPKQGGWQ